jgi:hypothetical protein
MDRDYWTKELHEAEAELAGAKRRTELNAAAKKLMRAKTEMKRLEAEAADLEQRPERPHAIDAIRRLQVHDEHRAVSHRSVQPTGDERR